LNSSQIINLGDRRRSTSEIKKHHFGIQLGKFLNEFNFAKAAMGMDCLKALIKNKTKIKRGK
jgi:hypothetical protein